MNQTFGLPHLGILVTTFCNLNCRHCADLIPMRRKTAYALSDVKKDLSAVLSAVDYIQELLVIGGETLLYPDLVELLDFCASVGKIRQLVITTNGVITPSSDMVSCFKRNRVRVRVSGYPDMLAPNRSAILKTLNLNNIEIVDLADMTWGYVGDFHDRGRTTEELVRVFQTCSMRDCVTLTQGGHIFFCSRQMCAWETDFYPDPHTDEYITLTSSGNLRQSLIDFYNHKYISTCNYCDGISCATTSTVPTAVQIMPKAEYLTLISLYMSWKESGFLMNSSLTSITRFLVERGEIFLQDLDEYWLFADCLTKLSEGISDELANLIKYTVLALINRCTDDYRFYADPAIPFAKQNDTAGYTNVIRVGLYRDVEKADIQSYDLLVTHEELVQAVHDAWPIEGMREHRLLQEGKLERIQHEPIECIVSGLSYTRLGIREKELPVPCVNISVGGQDITYETLLALKALDLNPSVRVVIMPITYYQGFYDISSDDAPFHEEIVSLVDIPVTGFSHNFTKNIDYENAGSFPILRIYEKICDLTSIRNIRDNNYRKQRAQQECELEYHPTGGLTFDFHTLDYSQKTESARITASLNERVLKTDPDGTETLYYLRKYLNECEKRNVTTVLFVPPMTEYLYEAYSDDLKEKYYNTIVPCIKQYPHAIFLDLARHNAFTDEDFIDFEHLGLSGAHKLTKIFADMDIWNH